MRALARELGARCAWCFVYIAEAHATDEWPIASARFNGDRGAVRLAQSRTTAARADAARAFACDFALEGAAEFVVDEPEAGEPFGAAFAPWPVRFFVLQQAALGGNDTQTVVRFVSSPHDSGFIDLAPFRRALLYAAAAVI